MKSSLHDPEANLILTTSSPNLLDSAKYSKSHLSGGSGSSALKMSEWDWQSLPTTNTTTVYRFGNSSFRFQTKFVLLVVILFVLCLIYAAMPSFNNNELSINSLRSGDIGGKRASLLWGSSNNNLNTDGSSFSPSSVDVVVSPNAINNLFGSSSSTTMKYPLTSPVQTEKGLKYRIGIISDLDTDSKTPNHSKWISYLRRGNLYLQFNKLEPHKSQVSIEWEASEPHVIKSGLNQDGRGMELSELFVFNGNLYTCDDRTGIIYHLQEGENEEVEPVPWVILADGNGTMPKGFKCEWACVKHGYLWVGGLGKEWTTNTGEIINHSPQFVKHISPTGEVVHMDWRGRYNKLAHAMNIYFPGYVIHESAGWSDILKKWMFLPRRASTEQYDDKTDEKKGTNAMLFVDESFENVEVKHVGEINPTHGFSSFKWIPGTDDQLVVALKSEEVEGKTATYLMVFDIKGQIIVPEMKVGEHKYEGIEFL